MSEGHHWNEQEGMLWIERDGLRFVIHPPTANGYVRFAVVDHRRPDHHPHRLVGSGTLENVPAAKNAAARMAKRLVTLGRHRA
jgi:hypothetical protein